MRPYLEYKDSGVPWLGPIPAHWSVRRGKRLFQRMQRPVRDADETVTCFRDGVVTLRLNRRTGGFTESLKEIGYQGVRQGDLVIHAMDAFAGAVGVSDSDGKCTPVYSICQPTGNANTHYYAYVVREMARTRYLEALARGIRERSSDFRFDTFASQPLPIPPFDEQQAIATFIIQVDRLTRRYVREQQKLIALLEEEKQAIIQRAVTRGLDPDAPLKPSGVDWLGEIPEQWKVRRLKNLLCCSLANGLFKKREFFGSVTPIVNVSDIYQDDFCVNPRQLELVEASASEIQTFRVAPRDILFVRSSLKLEGTGRSAYVESCDANTVFECHLVRARPALSQIQHRYLALYLNSTQARNYIVSRANTVTMSTVPQHALSAIPVALPDTDEQQRIIQFIDDRLRPVREAIECAQRRIALIREYCTRLIADVVTGKLDVRQAAANLPAEVEELADLVEEDIDQSEADTEAVDGE